MGETCRLDTEKKSVSYQQANRISRAVYHWLFNRLRGSHTLDNIYYMDEAGIKSTECYQWGWSLKGKRCEHPRLGGYGKRRNLIAAIRASDHEWQTPWVLTGTVNRTVVEHWLTAFGKQLGYQTAEQPSAILIMDNARFHKGGHLESIAKQFGIRLVYLPAYSPDLNPIERCWGQLKHAVRLLLGEGVVLDEAIDQVFTM